MSSEVSPFTNSSLAMQSSVCYVGGKKVSNCVLRSTGLQGDASGPRGATETHENLFILHQG